MKINRDDLEYIELFNSGYEGWVTLSSGKLVYISQPRSSAKETGLAMKYILNRMNEEKIKLESMC